MSSAELPRIVMECGPADAEMSVYYLYRYKHRDRAIRYSGELEESSLNFFASECAAYNRVIRELRHGGRRAAFARDEIEVIGQHTDNADLRKACAETLARKATAPAA